MSILLTLIMRRIFSDFGYVPKMFPCFNEIEISFLVIQHYLTLLEIRSFTTTILGFSRPQIGGRGIPRRKKVCFSRPHFCGRDR